MNQLPEVRHEAFRIERIVWFNDIPWNFVKELLTGKYRCSDSEADAIIRIFIRRFYVLNDLIWFIKPELTVGLNNLTACLCEYFGADTISVFRERQLSLGPLRVDYEVLVKFVPGFRRNNIHKDEHSCSPEVKIGFLGRQYFLRSRAEVLFLHSFLAFIGVLTYVIVIGCFLYSLSTFIVFLQDPSAVTLHATQHGSLGLALLCFSIGLAGLCSRAVTALIGWARARLALKQ